MTCRLTESPGSSCETCGFASVARAGVLGMGLIEATSMARRTGVFGENSASTRTNLSFGHRKDDLVSHVGTLVASAKATAPIRGTRWRWGSWSMSHSPKNNRDNRIGLDRNDCGSFPLADSRTSASYVDRRSTNEYLPRKARGGQADFFLGGANGSLRGFAALYSRFSSHFHSNSSRCNRSRSSHKRY